MEGTVVGIAKHSHCGIAAVSRERVVSLRAEIRGDLTVFKGKVSITEPTLCSAWWYLTSWHPGGAREERVQLIPLDDIFIRE